MLKPGGMHPKGNEAQALAAIELLGSAGRQALQRHELTPSTSILWWSSASASCSC